MVLNAFDALWESNIDINLLIVGSEGWKGLPDKERRSIPAITRRLDWHASRNKRLFWIADASDEFLEMAYRNSDCLIAASEDEGFGLPLIEAAKHEFFASMVRKNIRLYNRCAAFDAGSSLVEGLTPPE